MFRGNPSSRIETGDLSHAVTRGSRGWSGFSGPTRAELAALTSAWT